MEAGGPGLWTPTFQLLHWPVVGDELLVKSETLPRATCSLQLRLTLGEEFRYEPLADRGCHWRNECIGPEGRGGGTQHVHSISNSSCHVNWLPQERDQIIRFATITQSPKYVESGSGISSVVLSIFELGDISEILVLSLFIFTMRWLRPQCRKFIFPRSQNYSVASVVPDLEVCSFDS